MERYTIEDIELIRRKSGISYQEAVALLDYHNGNVARALVDLERNGRIKPAAAQPHAEKPQKRKSSLSSLFDRLFRCRVKIRKGDISIANLSLLFSLVALLISPHLVLLAAIVCLCLGYHISLDKRDLAFSSDNLDRMVKNAAQNVKSSVGDIARGFTEAMSDDSKTAESRASEAPQQHRSYYQSAPTAASAPVDYTGSAPVLQVPVQIETQDGKVEYGQDKDGFGNATIE